MNKVVWISVLNKEKNEANARKLYQAVSKYGLNAAGHFWQDDNFNMAWSASREDLVRQETSLWVIMGDADDFASETIRYGLSLLAVGVHAQKGLGFPILIVLTGGELNAETLPTQLKGADVIGLDNPSVGPKIVAKANTPVKKLETEYQADIYGLKGLGQWFEVGPAKGREWNGVMFGVDEGEITAHGVGPSNKLPERSVVEYPMKGLKLQLGDTEFTAWAVKNRLKDDESYYVRVNHFPKNIIFGPMSEGDDAEVFVVNLT